MIAFAIAIATAIHVVAAVAGKLSGSVLPQRQVRIAAIARLKIVEMRVAVSSF